MNQVTIAAYNILSGGFSDYSNNLPLPPDRFAKLKDAISMFHADFVGLIDTFRWEHDFKPEFLQTEFGYPFVKSISLDNTNLKEGTVDTGLTVLSKLSVTDCQPVKIFTRNALLTTVRIENQEVDIFTVYLDYANEDARLTQIMELLRVVNLNRPTIIMGDFNSLEPHEHLHLGNILGGFSTKYQQMIFQIWPKVMDMMQGKVIKFILDNGFTDGDDLKKPTAPTKLPNFPLHHAALRLDYAFSNKYVEISGLTVPQDDIFDQASDHYPIVFDVSLKG